MESSAKLLQNKSPAQLAREAWEGKSRVSQEELKKTKDIGGGVLVPSAFQVPNEIVDDGYLMTLNGAQLKVLLFIIRKTFGFNKIGGDKIPLSQIMEKTGLAKSTVIEATIALENDRLIRVIRGQSEDGMRKINYYQLITRGDYNRKKE